VNRTEASFDGLNVASFESRRADDMVRLIERSGGVPHVSPSMREVAIAENREAVDFAKAVMTGEIDLVIFMTGVGFRHLIGAVERQVDLQRFLATLSDIVTIARGPKPVVAMKEHGLAPTHLIPSPNTWREVLTEIDKHIHVANQNIGLQEYGKTNASLIAGLEARGATVKRVRVYDWDFPENIELLKTNVHALAAREIDVVLFTSANQLIHLLQLATQMELADEVRTGLERAVVCSIGPTTSETLRDCGLPVDFEPTQPKMGQLVREAAEVSGSLLAQKKRILLILSGPASDVMDPQAPWYDSPFMRACRCEPTDVRPVWLMRQAGRYLPEYREIRAKKSFLELCKDPALCAEIMVNTVKRLGVDAAIIFSDLLPILEPMGLDLEYSPGDGPVIHNPVRESADVDRVVELESVESLDFVIETVRQTRNDLPADIPLIGFAGAPFTLASYVIEGGASRNYLHTKTLMYRDEGAWKELMQRFSRSVVKYLNAQITAGAQCVQLFDSWVGCLSPEDYRRFVLPHVQEILEELIPGVPVINFATGNPSLLPCLAESGASVIGVDWRISLDQAWQMIGYEHAVQGNLDPTVLLADAREVRRRAREILNMTKGRLGHIFNLGHGVLPQTPVDNVKVLIDTVHEYHGEIRP